MFDISLFDWTPVLLVYILTILTILWGWLIVNWCIKWHSDRMERKAQEQREEQEWQEKIAAYWKHLESPEGIAETKKTYKDGLAVLARTDQQIKNLRSQAHLTPVEQSLLERLEANSRSLHMGLTEYEYHFRKYLNAPEPRIPLKREMSDV